MEQMLSNKLSQSVSIAGSSGTQMVASATQMLYEYLDYISHAVDNALDYQELYDKFMPIAQRDDARIIVLGTEPENAIDKELFERRLNQENIMFMGGDSVRECIVTKADGSEDIKKGYVYFFDKEDIPEVYQIRNELTNCPELTKTLKITDLKGVEAQRIHDHLEEIGVHSEIYENRNRVYNLLYSPNDRRAVDYAKAVTAIELSGEDGKGIEKDFDYWMEQSEELEKRIFDNTQQETFYVVNQNASIEVNKKNVVFKEPNHQAIVIPKSEECRGAVCGCFRKMGRFAVIEKDQIKTWEDDKSVFFERKIHEMEVPEYTEEMQVQAGQKMENLESFLKVIDDDMTVDSRTQLLIAKESSELQSMEPDQKKELIDEAFHHYNLLEDTDKMQTIDSTLRQALEEELEKGNTLENIEKSLEQRREDVEKELESMSEEEKQEMSEMFSQQKEELWDSISRGDWAQ